MTVQELEELRAKLNTPKPPTLGDIADRAGVARATVQRLAEGKIVTNANADAIARAVEELGL